MSEQPAETRKQPPLILGRRLTYMVATIAILLAGVYLGVGLWLARQQFVDEFTSIADLTVDASRGSLTEADPTQDLQDRLVRTLAQARRLNASTQYIFVTDDHGQIVAATFSGPASAPLLEVARQHVQAGGWRRSVDFELDGHDVHHLSVAMPRGQPGYLHFGFDATSVAIKVKGMALRLFSSMLIGLLASAFLGWWIYRWMSRPIRDLTAAVAAFGEGDLKQRVPLTSPGGDDEVALLAQSFNRMADTIEQKMMEQQAAQQSLAREKRLIQLILDGLIHGVAYYEADGSVAYWNQAAQKHWEWTKTAKPLGFADLHQHQPQVLSAIESLRASTAICRHVTLERHGQHFDVFLSKIEGQEVGRPIGIVEISVDITHQIQTSRFLAHAEKLNVVGQLAAGFAHEINSPLDGAIEVARMLEKGGAAPELVRYVQAQRTALERIAVIIRRLLTFSRRNDAPITLLEIWDPISEAVELVRYRVEKRTIKLELPDRRVSQVAVKGEMLGLSQVFVNLLSNAIDATPDGSTVKIEMSHTDQTVSIAVVDQGGGIPERLKDRIFTPFFTTKDVGRGTGLGLAISKNIIVEHGGRMEFRNEPQPWGARFTVHLPCLSMGSAASLAESAGGWNADNNLERATNQATAVTG